MCMYMYLHHVLLLGEVAVELEILFGRCLLRPQGEDGLLLELPLARYEDSMEMVHQLVCVWEGGGEGGRGGGGRKGGREGGG